jgi:hypothetical protein
LIHSFFFSCIYFPRQAISSKVFFDVEIEGGEGGRIVMGLFGEDVPKTAENFVSWIDFLPAEITLWPASQLERRLFFPDTYHFFCL